MIEAHEYIASIFTAIDMSDPGLTKLLASYVPKLIQKRVIQDSAPIVSPLLQDFPAVALFTGISGFTALSERLGDKDPVGVETKVT